uniref:Mesothelin a n=1 Tax=Oryzias melastigma TaxID=30732 RepID=A0A3B3CMK3_ORYME
MKVLETLKVVCSNLDEQIYAALASNFKGNLDSSSITALGNQSTSLSTGQIKTISSSQLISSLSTLSIVTGWREGQAKTIIQTLMSSGLMKINSSSSLSQLGSLVIGLPSYTFSSISSLELISASKNPSIVAYIMSGSQILQQSFVYQIVSSDTNSLKIIDNIPDQLATQVPRVYLQQFTSDKVTIEKLNKKTWKRQQVELFFDIIAADSATTVLEGADNLSSSVLQGFTCTGVSQFSRTQVTKLVKACRRKGSRKVPLLETQLTCMYNYISTESDATSFALYPPDMLLYYDYSLVPQSSCRSYFQELADADFSVFSSVLSYKQTALFNNARSCLGITSTSLTADQVSILGNMCCMLDGSYIQNSDPSILEKLKNCPDLTASQAAAVTTLLISGNTQYGNTSTWNETTLKNLDMLPLYLPTTFYDNFDKNTKKTFLKSFLNVIKEKGVSRYKRQELKSVIRQSIKNRSKRTTDCTVGTITQFTISESTFPFDYDVAQFNNCLSNVTVKDNFDAITEKVDEVDYLKIVLHKLGEAYNFIIPEDQVQVLGFASSVATTDDIRSWTITQVDTLSALMDSSNGVWEPSLAKEIISKYLAVEGNSLGRAELNAIKGPYLCTLDLSVIQSITAQSLKEAEALNITTCTLEAKKAIFNIATQSFRAITQASPSYLLSRSFLGGASLNYIQGLVPSSINMDLETFSNLDPNVVLGLTVTEVKGLLGTNLPDLKSYENQPLVQTWIRNQYQSDLNTLGLNLSGGKADPVTTATNAPATAGSGGSTGESETKWELKIKHVGKVSNKK